MTYKQNKAWRKRYPKKWQAGKQRYYAKTAGPEINLNHQQRWTTGEITMLFPFIDLYTDTELHGILGRSVRAIQVMRSKLKDE